MVCLSSLQCCSQEPVERSVVCVDAAGHPQPPFFCSHLHRNSSIKTCQGGPCINGGCSWVPKRWFKVCALSLLFRRLQKFYYIEGLYVAIFNTRPTTGACIPNSNTKHLSRIQHWYPCHSYFKGCFVIVVYLHTVCGRYAMTYYYFISSFITKCLCAHSEILRYAHLIPIFAPTPTYTVQQHVWPGCGAEKREMS